MLEAGIRQLESPALTGGLRDLLAPLVTLFAAAAVERDLSWYLTQEIVPAKVSCLRYVAAMLLLLAQGMWVFAFFLCLRLLQQVWEGTVMAAKKSYQPCNSGRILCV